MSRLVVYFNPSQKKYESVLTLGSCLGTVNEWRFLPLGIKYVNERPIAVRQALSRNQNRSKFFRKVKSFLYRLQHSGVREFFEKNKSAVAICWNARSGVRHIFMDAARAAGVRVVFLELAPFPNMIAADANGINFENSVPRNASFYNSIKHNEAAVRDLSSALSQRGGNPRGLKELNLELRDFIFVPLQSDGDSQLLDYGLNFTTVRYFLQTICDLSNFLPPGRKILVKQHPACDVGAEKLCSAYPNVEVVDQFDTIELCRHAKTILTVNSSVGLQGILLGKPVAIVGQAFWSIEGVCEQLRSRSEIKNYIQRNTYEFDERIMKGFITFLVSEYYIKLNWQADGRVSVAAREKEKLYKIVDGAVALS